MQSTRKPAMTEGPVIQLRDLTVEFRTAGAWHSAVRSVDFEIGRNETLALVGESGSGKSVTSLAMMGLIPARSGRIASGQIMLGDTDLAKLSEKDLDAIRGNRVAMIFQEPMTALNPTMRVGDQVAESLRAHRGMDRAAALKESERMLDLVRIPSAAQRMRDYPHQFSGGMRQRVMIAMALACRPDVLLADEPTTALDVTIQAQVLSLIEDLKREYGLAVLFITHNLGVVALIADRVAVMYAGEIVETSPASEIFDSPQHPYTEALLASMPRVDRDLGALDPLRGNVPSIRERGTGCAFAPRCPLVIERCRTQHPVLNETGPARSVRCWVRGVSHA
ncbi:MAG: dipeptide/oligopeptide/nickel transporter ATP-binding protein [Ramlibacter sp.]|nr:dipeptide/oligopeptide/nickel transporter ATP-binding protein [Ramlibacter sp.]